MRILLYLPGAGALTGAPRRLLILASGIRELGAVPILVTEPDTALMQAANKAGIETAPLSLTGVLAMREKALFGGGLIFRLRIASALVEHNLRFCRVVRSARGDVVWMRSSKSIAFAAPGAVLSRRPLIWDVGYELPSSGAVRLLHRLGLALARCVVFQHDAARNLFGSRLAQRHEEKFRILTPGIDMAALLAARARVLTEPRKAQDRFRILQVGTIGDRKNQAFLIEALHHLPDHMRQQIELRLVGGTYSSSYERALQDKVAAYGLTDQVRFLGWRDDVHALMLDSDLLVMPSKDEGVPNAVQEAMALGLPVLGSDRGGIPEVLDHGKTGWVLPIDDPARWTETIGRLIKEPETLARVGESARVHAETHFANDAWCARYLQVFEEALASRKGR
ncbi:MAG: glycosyltransferase family 4 protein [Rhodobacteraceae bacterium]|nr:glycosyltransferase family 4 protein [Paracoccaceae bacterium]